MPTHRFVSSAASAAVLALFAGPAIAWGAESITLDFVRHGEAGDNLVINDDFPGPPLTSQGWQQADDVAQVLLHGGGIDGIFASAMTRAQQTAEPLAEALQLWPLAADHVLPGLNEIGAGVFAGLPLDVGGLPLGAVAYALAPFLWSLGLYFVPQLGSSDANGMVFQDRFTDAVQQIYDVGQGNGATTDAVFAHEASIVFWTLMNAKNPDFPLIFNQALTTGELLPYTGIIEVRGNSTDGWTLVSWDGQPVPEDPGLLTELFVDFRDLITVPQMAAYHLWEAIVGGDPTTITAAFATGADEIGAALTQFPVAVFDDLFGATWAA
ncbi:phosphoglycerate mutase family protein [Mycolicibacter sinensis]|jgi:broad specificity phosphatase PhoE